MPFKLPNDWYRPLINLEVISSVKMNSFALCHSLCYFRSMETNVVHKMNASYISEHNRQSTALNPLLDCFYCPMCMWMGVLHEWCSALKVWHSWHLLVSIPKDRVGQVPWVSLTNLIHNTKPGRVGWCVGVGNTQMYTYPSVCSFCPLSQFSIWQTLAALIPCI